MTVLWLSLALLSPALSGSDPDLSEAAAPSGPTIPGADIDLPDAAYLLVVDDLSLAAASGGWFPMLQRLLDDSDAAILNCRTRSDSYDSGKIHRRAYLHAAAAGRRLPVGGSEQIGLAEPGWVRYDGLEAAEPYGRLGQALEEGGWRVAATSLLPPDTDGPPDIGLLALNASREARFVDCDELRTVAAEAPPAPTLFVVAAMPEQAELLLPRLRDAADRTGVPLFLLAMPPRGETWASERMALFLRYGTGPGLLGTATTRRAGVMRITDICPTVLASLGLEPPLDMEGRAAWRTRPRAEGNAATLAGLMSAVLTSEKGRTPLFRTLVRFTLLLAFFAAAVWPARGDSTGRRLLRMLGLWCLVPVPAFLLCFSTREGLAFVGSTMHLLGRFEMMTPAARSVHVYWTLAALAALLGWVLLDGSLRVRRSAPWVDEVADFVQLLTRALGLGLMVFPAMLVLPVFTDGALPARGVMRALFAAAGTGGFLAALPWRRLAVVLACAAGPVTFTIDQLTGGNLAAFSFFGYCLSRDSRLYGMGNSLCILFVVQTLLLVGVLAGPRGARSGRDTRRRVALAALLLVPTFVIGSPTLGAQTGGLLYGAFALALAAGVGFGSATAVLLWLVIGPLLAGGVLLLGAWLDVRLHKDPTTHFGLALKDVLDGNSEWVRRTIEGRFRLMRERFSYPLWWGPIGAAGLLVPWAAVGPEAEDAPPLAYIAAGLATAVFAGLTDDSGNVMVAMGCVPLVAAVLLRAAGRYETNEG